MESFHWEIEFPEVFDREQPRIRCHCRKSTLCREEGTSHSLSGSNPIRLHGLAQGNSSHEGASGGNADLVAHFYRKVLSISCGPERGNLRTHSQPTRLLRVIPDQLAFVGFVKNGGEIYSAQSDELNGLVKRRSL